MSDVIDKMFARISRWLPWGPRMPVYDGVNVAPSAPERPPNTQAASPGPRRPSDPEQKALDRALFRFPGSPGAKPDMFSFRNAFEGVQVFGATGSGKTTGSGRTLALALLQARFAGKHRFGGLVLTAKPGEAKLWKEYTEIANRQSHYRVVKVDGSDRFDFLNYERRHHEKTGGGVTQNLVSLFTGAMETGQQGVGSGDPYWHDALQQLLTHAIDLAVMATGEVALADLLEIVRTAPQTREEALSLAWATGGGRCSTCLRQAANRHPERSHALLLDYNDTADYWTKDFAGLAERTRSVVVSSFTSKATALLRRPMRQMFAGPDTFTPEDTFNGKIIVLDMSVKEYGEAGRFAQMLLKTVWQRAVERRDLNEYPAPVFLWADESQYFITSEDMLFQQTARSKRAATVYLTQSLSNYYATLAGRGGRAAVDSLLGNLQTKIFHANGDPITNEYAERVFAKDYRITQSTSVSQHTQSIQSGPQLRENVLASEFARLQKGGPECDCLVEGIVFGARQWNGSGTSALHVLFDQEVESPSV